MKSFFANFRVRIFFISLTLLEFEAATCHSRIESFEAIDTLFLPELFRKNHIVSERYVLEYFYYFRKIETCNPASYFRYVEY